MGILDEAIREHLDLKRRHGAQDSEVKRLEDEAFGLPTRPGEPDFPESEEQPAAPAAQDATATATPAAPEADAARVEPEATATEHPVVEAEPTPPAPEPEREPAPEPPSEEATLFYDQAGSGAAEQEESREALMDEAQLEEAPPPADEHPVAAEETVEHPMEEELGREEPAPVEDQPFPAEDEPLTGEEDPEEQGEGADEEGADVLEETPEFLRDQPEDDELWFEQGEPKDFDFD